MKHIPDHTSQTCVETCIEVGKQLYKWFDQRLQEVGLTPVQLGVLTLLAPRDGLTMGELREGMCCAGSNVTALIGRMLEAGWVRRRKDQSDGRVRLVEITPSGRDLLAAATETPRCCPEAADWLTAGEWRELCRLLGRVRARLEMQLGFAPRTSARR